MLLWENSLETLTYIYILMEPYEHYLGVSKSSTTLNSCIPNDILIDRRPSDDFRSDILVLFILYFCLNFPVLCATGTEI